MTFNINNWVNDVLSGIVFYVYRHVGALYLLARFPLRGPKILSRLNLRDEGQKLSPHAFLLVNTFATLVLLEVSIPTSYESITAFLFEAATGPADLGDAVRQLAYEIKGLRKADVDLLPLAVRSIIIIVSADLAVRLLTEWILTCRRRELIRGEILFSLGFQPLVFLLCSATLVESLSRHSIALRGLAISILVLGSLPTVLVGAGQLAPPPRLRLRPTASASFSAVWMILLVTGLYAEAGFLITRTIGDKPRRVEIGALRCKTGEVDRTDPTAQKLEIAALIENNTSRSLVLDPKQISVDVDPPVAANVMPRPVMTTSIDSLETSAPPDHAFFVLKNGESMWVRARGRIQTRTAESVQTDPVFFMSPDKCHAVVRIGFIQLETDGMFW